MVRTYDIINPNETKSRDSEQTTNKAGGVAFDSLTPELGLYKKVANQLLEDAYYESVTDAFVELQVQFEIVAETNPEYVLQLAVHARQVMGLRDVPQALLVLAANDERTQPYVAEYTPDIIDRTDEFNTVISMQLGLFGRPVPKPLQNGIEDALHKRWAMVKVNGPPFDEDPVARVTWIEDGSDQIPYSVVSEGEQRVYEQNGVSMDVENFGVDITDSGYVHDKYRFAKYMQRSREVSLYDVINLTRPNPRTDNRDDLFERITRGDMEEYEDVEPLRQHRTWETEATERGSGPEMWRDTLPEMGIMARIRNLRNMREAGLTGDEIFDYDEGGEFGPNSAEIVEHSKQFPFRYYTAYVALKNDRGVRASSVGHDRVTETWLEGAIDHSAKNLPDDLTDTYTGVDLSGSMTSEISGNSIIMRKEIASLFGAVMMKHQSDVGVFGSDFAEVSISDTDRAEMKVLDLADQIKSFDVGHDTNGWLVLQHLIDNNESYDRIVIFSDMQIWGRRSMKGCWDEYTSKVNPDAELYLIDLASYGSLQMPEGYHNVHQISGWNSEVLDYIEATEDNPVEEIEDIDPGDY